MDLGATICTPAKPRCVRCPWLEACAAREAGIAEDLPTRRAKKRRPLRRGVAFVALRDGAVLLRRRPERGLLGGLLEVPSTEWRAESWEEAEALQAAPAPASWRTLPGTVRHVFTHFALELEVRVARTDEVDGLWVPIDRLGGEAIPSVMRKVLERALGSA